MPVIKPIAGHTSCQGVKRYLEKNGRALAVDLLNLSWDEDRDGHLDPDLKNEIDWADEMDLTRIANGNDTPWRGKRARTYMHFVVSPDPKDKITLPQLRDLAKAWCRENWRDFECAIVYHDDNENEVMHAHVVVNNTNLSTGKRFQNPNPREMQASIQKLAQERGLSFFVNESNEEQGKGKNQPRTKQQVYVRRAEREIAEKGGYSWVADIRARVTIAKRIAQNPSDYAKILMAMGVKVTDSSLRHGRRDWLYSLAGSESRQIRGENLGLAYGRQAIERSFEPSAPTRESAREIASKAIELEDFSKLESLADVLELQSRFGIRSLSDYERRIETIERRGNADLADQLREAYAFASNNRLLPSRQAQRVPQTTTRQDVAARTPRGPSSASEQAAVRQRQVLQEQSSRNRNERNR